MPDLLQQSGKTMLNEIILVIAGTGIHLLQKLPLRIAYWKYDSGAVVVTIGVIFRSRKQ